MSWTQAQQCGPSVVIRARRQATMWSHSGRASAYKNFTRYGLVRDYSLLLGSGWIMKWWCVIQIVSNGFDCPKEDKKTKHKGAFVYLQTHMSKHEAIMCFSVYAVSYQYIAQQWPWIYEWQEGSPCGMPLWHTDNNAVPAAATRSVRQTVTLPAAGLFGKPCWIAHFVCGIRAGQSCFICWYLSYQPANALTKHSGVVPQWVCTHKRQNQIKKYVLQCEFSIIQ